MHHDIRRRTLLNQDGLNSQLFQRHLQGERYEDQYSRDY